VVDSLLGIVTEAVFLLTSNCFRNFRGTNMPQAMRLFALTSSREPDVDRETVGLLNE
jgi:hypothetical protein